MNAPRSDSGVYIYVFEVAEGALVRAGALGRIHIHRGLYAYVGSAKRAMGKRLARHRRKRKPMRWHIDYLARAARPMGAVTWAWSEGRECRIAALLQSLGLGESVVKGFGASDCNCGGHLFRLSVNDLDKVATELGADIGEVGAVISYQK